MQRNCKECNEPIPSTRPRSQFCSEKCYQRNYYKVNIESKKAYDKAKYVPRPRPEITEEILLERKQRQKEVQRKYREEHKEYYKMKAREHYLNNKDNPEYRRRHIEASKRYMKRRRENKE